MQDNTLFLHVIILGIMLLNCIIILGIMSMFNIPMTNNLCTYTQAGFRLWGFQEIKTDTVIASYFGGGSVLDKAISVG